MLRKLIQAESRADWEEKLAAALWALRTNVSTVHGYSPFLLHHARPCRVPVSDLVSGDSEYTFENRLQLASEVFQQVAQATKDSRVYNRDRLKAKATAGDIKPGDSVILKANEPLSLTARWDYGYIVTDVRGLTISLLHPETGARLQVHREKVKLVDPDIPWDEISPRPRRKRIQQDRQVRRRDSLPRRRDSLPRRRDSLPQRRDSLSRSQRRPVPSVQSREPTAPTQGTKRPRSPTSPEPAITKRVLRSYKRPAEEAGASEPPAKRTWHQLDLLDFVRQFLPSL